VSTFQTIADTLKGLANNAAGVNTTANPPMTDTASSHSVTIRTSNGIKVGRIQSWAPQMSRVVDTLFEVQQRATGEPVEQVPQVQNTNQVAVERYEMYTFRMGEAFGVPVTAGTQVLGSARNDLVSLTLATKPFNVREVWRDPYGNIRAYAYVGCVFSDVGYTVSATDDRIVKARATLKFTRKLILA